MPQHKYLIIGGGMTAAAAVKGIRSADPAGTIGIMSAEKHPPYNRPPLSKALWKGEPLESIWRKLPEKIDFFASVTATSLDTKNKVATDEHGEQYRYNRLLLATGGSVRRLPDAPEGVIYFRTLDDYHALRGLSARNSRFVVIGGGFIGAEVAAALAMNKKTVTMIFPDEGIGSRIYPQDLSHFLAGYYREKGVDVAAGDSVVAITRNGPLFIVKTRGGREIIADGVIAGIGITPNTSLAESAGLKIDNGIIVDAYLESSSPNVYAAGDVANFPNAILGRRMRVEHEDNANIMGEVAGKNMAGAMTAYRHLPFFYSDLFDLGYEAVGDTVAGMETYADWKEKFREGVVYYLEKGRVRGVLLWNTWGQVEAARMLIAEKGPFDGKNLKGRLPA